MCQFAEELWESLSYYITSGESVGGACVLNYKTAQVHTHTLSVKGLIKCRSAVPQGGVYCGLSRSNGALYATPRCSCGGLGVERAGAVPVRVCGLHVVLCGGHAPIRDGYQPVMGRRMGPAGTSDYCLDALTLTVKPSDKNHFQRNAW
jgi:hypothetical protein